MPSWKADVRPPCPGSETAEHSVPSSNSSAEARAGREWKLAIASTNLYQLHNTWTSMPESPCTDKSAGERGHHDACLYGVFSIGTRLGVFDGNTTGRFRWEHEFCT